MEWDSASSQADPFRLGISIRTGCFMEPHLSFSWTFLRVKHYISIGPYLPFLEISMGWNITSSLDCTFLFPESCRGKILCLHRTIPSFSWNLRVVECHISIGLYLPFPKSWWGGSLRLHWTVPPLLKFGWGGPLCLCWTVPPLLGFGWGGPLRFHWTVPSFLLSSSNDFLFVVHLGFIIARKKGIVKRKIRKF